MSDKLGFTFYPKDWWASESYFELNAIQRYYYLECLFIMYSNEGYMKTQKTQFENRMRETVSDTDWSEVTSKFILDTKGFTHLSVNKRLRKTVANRENGKKGGRPPKEDEKPKKPKSETQKNPPLERERESEVKREREIKNNIDDRKSRFADTLKPFLKTYGKDMLNDFYRYWTEPTNSGTKFRRELEKTWEISRRLESWAKREKPKTNQAAVPAPDHSKRDRF